MPLTRSFKELVKERADRDPDFRAALLAEAAEALLADDFATARHLFRDLINATMGFERLATETGLPAKSLMRMFGPGGNPTGRNLFRVVAVLAAAEGLALEVTPRARTETDGESRENPPSAEATPSEDRAA